jgi:hypothetical protein
MACIFKNLLTEWTRNGGAGHRSLFHLIALSSFWGEAQKTRPDAPREMSAALILDFLLSVRPYPNIRKYLIFLQPILMSF